MKSYIIRGHGEILPENQAFKLKNGQYVVFAQQCGEPALFGTTMKSPVMKMLKDPNKLMRFIRGNYNKRVFPHAFRNPIILGPGNTVRNMYLEMYDPEFMNRMGVFNAHGYIGGRNKTMKLSSQNALGNRKGVFFIDSCRTNPNYENLNIYAERIFRGQPSGIPVTSANVRTRAYETYRTRRFLAKRKRPSQNITLKRETSSPIIKKRARITVSRKRKANSPINNFHPRKKRMLVKK